MIDNLFMPIAIVMAVLITGIFHILGKFIENKEPKIRIIPKGEPTKTRWVSNRELFIYAVFSLFMLCLTFYGLSTIYKEEISRSKDVFAIATYAVSIPFFFSILALSLSLLYHLNKKSHPVKDEA